MANNPNPARSRRTRAVLADEVFRSIGAAIRDGRLQPGEPLRDAELAEQLGVSRTPVREALQRLSRIGLVEIVANRYTRVTRTTPEQREDTRTFAIFSAIAALRVAALRATDEELDRALFLLDEMGAASETGDERRFVAASARLYGTLILLTHNDVFVRVMRETSLTFQRDLQNWSPFVLEPEVRVQTYRMLRAALAARDGAGAERVFRGALGID